MLHSHFQGMLKQWVRPVFLYPCPFFGIPPARTGRQSVSPSQMHRQRVLQRFYVGIPYNLVSCHTSCTDQAKDTGRVRWVPGRGSQNSTICLFPRFRERMVNAQHHNTNFKKVQIFGQVRGEQTMAFAIQYHERYSHTRKRRTRPQGTMGP